MDCGLPRDLSRSKRCLSCFVTHLREKNRLNNIVWRQRSHDELLRRSRERYAANREQIRAQENARRRANPELERAKRRAWRQANADKVRAQRARHRARHRDWGDGAKLSGMIDAAVPESLPPLWREEVCQDVAVAILTGQFARTDLKQAVEVMTKAAFQKFSKFGPISLDAPYKGSLNENSSLKDRLSVDN